MTGTEHIKAILFDKDGTLLDFDRTWLQINEDVALLAARGNADLAHHLLKVGGQDPVTREIRAGSLLAAGNASEISRAWVDAGSDFDHPALTAEIDLMCVKGMERAVPLPRVQETIEQLHQDGYRLGVASSDSQAAIHAFLKGSGLAGYMEFVAGYDSGHGPKPEPGMLTAFADALGLPTSQIAMIGDNTHDLEMARSAKAGLSIGVLSGTSSCEDLQGLADHVLASVAELGAYLQCAPSKNECA